MPQNANRRRQRSISKKLHTSDFNKAVDRTVKANTQPGGGPTHKAPAFFESDTPGHTDVGTEIEKMVSQPGTFTTRPGGRLKRRKKK